MNRTKCAIRLSITGAGSEYFLSNNVRINIDVAPLYIPDMVANLCIATAECCTGILTFCNTLAIIIASRKVQYANSLHNGSNIPLKNAAGLYTAFFNDM